MVQRDIRPFCLPLRPLPWKEKRSSYLIVINAQPEEAAPGEIKLKRINTAHCGIRRVPRGGCTHATPCTPLETTLRTTPSRRSVCSPPFLTPALPPPAFLSRPFETVYNDEHLFFSYFRAFLATVNADDGGHE